VYSGILFAVVLLGDRLAHRNAGRRRRVRVDAVYRLPIVTRRSAGRDLPAGSLEFLL